MLVVEAVEVVDMLVVDMLIVEMVVVVVVVVVVTEFNQVTGQNILYYPEGVFTDSLHLCRPVDVLCQNGDIAAYLLHF